MSPAFCCPRCLTPVARDADSFVCEACGSSYPIVCGIPDFRVEPDPYIGLDDDRAKALRMAEAARGVDLAGLVRHYFDITPEVPAPLAAHYTQNILELAPARAQAFLEPLAEREEAEGSLRILEVGCGSGPFLPTLGRRHPGVVGVDVALRWLVVARQRLSELGVDAQLVCACAEHLPFPPSRFDALVAANVIEHVRDADRALAEFHRVLDDDGIAVFSTPNRTSLAPDPHVGVWGVGFLPRSWMDRYARLVRGVGLEKVHVRGYPALRALLARSGFRSVRFSLPAISEVELSRLGPRARRLGRIYNAAVPWRLLRGVLLLFGPFFRIVARKAPGAQGARSQSAR